MAKLISKTYGDALLEIAVEESKIDVFAEEITAIMSILNENPDFGKLMNNPRISVEGKQDVLKNVFEGKISKEILGFFSMIISKGRYAQIDEILEYFLGEVKKINGVGVAFVKTPVELKPQQKANIEKRLLETNPPSFSRSSSFLYSLTTQGKKQLEQEAEIYKKIGIPYITTNEIELNIPIQLALGMENEGQINPLAFAQHFAQLARKYGAQLFTNTRITHIQPNKNSVTTNNGYT